MLGTRVRQRLLSVPVLMTLAVLIALAAVPIAGYGQNTGGCVPNPTGLCSGTCSIGGAQGTCITGENACVCALAPYTLTLAPFSPATVNRGEKATSTVTISPSGNGAVGSVLLSILNCPSSVICTLDPYTVPSAPGTSQLTVTVPVTFRGAQVTITVTGAATYGFGGGPSNGPQSVTLNIAGLSMVSVVTQRYNAQRTGANLQEHILNVAAVSSPEFQKLYTTPTIGQVYAQPLLVLQVPFPDGTLKNVLIVATMLNAVQAFQVDDALHPAFAPIPLWSTTIGSPGTPLPANFMAMAGTGCYYVFGFCNTPGGIPSTPAPLPPIPSSPHFIVSNHLGLYNINPSIGIVSTPVIDPASSRYFRGRQGLGGKPAYCEEYSGEDRFGKRQYPREHCNRRQCLDTELGGGRRSERRPFVRANPSHAASGAPAATWRTLRRARLSSRYKAMARLDFSIRFQFSPTESVLVLNPQRRRRFDLAGRWWNCRRWP